MERPFLDLDQLELNGVRIHDAHKQGTQVRIEYFKDNEFKEIFCYIDEPINIWNMVIKCSNEEGKMKIPFNWIVQVEPV